MLIFVLVVFNNVQSRIQRQEKIWTKLGDSGGFGLNKWIGALIKSHVTPTIRAEEVFTQHYSGVTHSPRGDGNQTCFVTRQERMENRYFSDGEAGRPAVCPHHSIVSQQPNLA